MQNNPSGDKEIFLAALDLPKSERQGYLEHACGGDEVLRQRIEALLESAEEPDKLLDQERIEVAMSAGNDSATLTEQSSETERVGTVIGHYKLLQQIGEGGMGSVFMAHQTKPVDRRVALKIIKPGMDSRQIVARFEAERQALAMMDHPNIARVFDAGTTQSARPYFVMELVNGIPITQYCDEQHLSTRERLELFVPVCQAVQHAHQKGIIHRDLKPSNILVALYDHRAVPKVIDFGVAKATSQSLTDKTLFTQFGQIIGTLEYMSPEQARRNQLDVDTRSDVYSLGMVLYELLTGTTPFDKRRLREAALDEILRIIRDEEPPRPSARLSTVDTLPSIAANRRIEPVRLQRMLTGELDWIVMKALEKDRSRRYETANGFADDIGRYLANEHVVACPPSTAYRVRKFASKNRSLLVTLTSLAAVLLCATILSTWWGIRATNAEKAERLLSDRYKNLSEEKAALADKEKAARVKSEENEKLAISERERAEENAATARHNQYIAHMQQLRHEWNNNDVGRVREILDRYRVPVAGQADERGWEWYYWDRMCHLDLRTLKGHKKSVNGIAFSPDSSLVASASSDGTVKLWEVATGRLVHTFECHGNAVSSVAFHPGGKMIGTGGGFIPGSGGEENQAIIWDIETGTPLYKLEHSTVVTCVAFSPNGEFFATGTGPAKEGGQRKIWKVATGECLHTFVQRSSVESIAFTADSTRIVCAATPNVEMWELAADKLTKLVTHESLMDNNFQLEPITAAALSLNEKTLATSSLDRTIKIWDLQSGKEQKTIPAHLDGVNSVVFHPKENLVASASIDRSIRVWDASTGAERLVLRGHTDAVRRIAISPDGMRLASASMDGTIKIWDINQRMDTRYLLASDLRHFDSINFCPGGHELVYTRAFEGEKEMGIWAEVCNAATQENFRVFRGGHKFFIRSVALSRDGKLLATGEGSSNVQIWNCQTGEVIHVLKGHFAGSGSGMVFSPDASLLVASCSVFDKASRKITTSTKVFDTATGQLLHSFAGPHRIFAFTPDGAALATATEKAIEVVEPRTGKVIRSFPVEIRVSTLQFDPAGKVLAGNVTSDGSSSNLIVWDYSTGNQLLEISKPGKLIGFDSTGSRMFTDARSESLNVWERTTGDLVCTIKAPTKESKFASMAISSDSNLVAIRNFPTIFIMDLIPDSDEVSIQRESQALVAHLLKFPLADPPFLVARKSELLAELKGLKSISESVRRESTRLINSVLAPSDESDQFARAAWFVLVGDDPATATNQLPKIGRPNVQQIQLGLQYARTAFEIDTNNSFSMFVYGAALCENQQYRESIKYLQLAIAHPISNENINAIARGYLARSLHHIGEFEKAKEELALARASPYARYKEVAQQIELAAALIEGREKRE